MNDRFLLYTKDIKFFSFELIARLKRNSGPLGRWLKKMISFQFCALLIYTSLLYAGKMKLILMHTNVCKNLLTPNTITN